MFSKPNIYSWFEKSVKCSLAPPRSRGKLINMRKRQRIRARHEIQTPFPWTKSGSHGLSATILTADFGNFFGLNWRFRNIFATVLWEKDSTRYMSGFCGRTEVERPDLRDFSRAILDARSTELPALKFFLLERKNLAKHAEIATAARKPPPQQG